MFPASPIANHSIDSSMSDFTNVAYREPRQHNSGPSSLSLTKPQFQNSKYKPKPSRQRPSKNKPTIYKHKHTPFSIFIFLDPYITRTCFHITTTIATTKSSFTTTKSITQSSPYANPSKNYITKPKTKYSLSVATTPIIPTTVTQAMRDEKWRNAMFMVFDAVVRNGTFDLVPPMPTQNVIPTKWIYTLKYLPNGSLDRYKARLVARRFNQQYGVDYVETFIPVIKSTTVQLVLEHVVRCSWSIRQLDVNNAFLQGTLTGDVYVMQPPGFVDQENSNHVCKLNKTLYGLKQAPHVWYAELKAYLLAVGFQNLVADTSLFTYHRGSDVVYIMVYVDDIVVTESTDVHITNVISELARRFSIKDLGNLSYFLGIKATRTSAGLYLMQWKYVIDLLNKTRMLDARPVSTPMAPHSKLSIISGSPLSNPTEYRMVIGNLQYLAFTRPDIAYAVNKLSQYMHASTDDHWQAAKRVLRYLAGTVSHGIFLRKDSPFMLHAFSDANWTGDMDDYVSTNAYIIYLGSTSMS